jgi:hypothetical protein
MFFVRFLFFILTCKLDLVQSGGYFHGLEIESDSKLFEIHNYTIVKENKPKNSIFIHAKLVKKALKEFKLEILNLIFLFKV